MTSRAALAVAAVVALALPAQASAHGRAPVIALDFQLRLALLGPADKFEARILDGDRDLRMRVTGARQVIVRGRLGEAMLRIGPDGVWVNADSATATADRLAPAGKSGWLKVSGGSAFTWHESRLAPPPVTTAGYAGSLGIPLTVDGRRTALRVTFWRVVRPSAWPWLAGALVFLAAVAFAARRPAWRPALTVGLGVGAGLAALLAVTTFAVRDAPNGGTAWLQVGAALAIGIVLTGVLLFLHGRHRAHAAGIVGGIAAAASIGSLSVFWHGVVISALPPTFARLACGFALVGGAAAAALSFLPDFDEPRRVPR